MVGGPKKVWSKDINRLRGSKFQLFVCFHNPPRFSLGSSFLLFFSVGMKRRERKKDGESLGIPE